jgi:GGDEF domain-containing protein
MSTIEQLQEENAKLRAEIEKLRTHAPYGILTRAAFEIEKRKFTDGQYVVFGDVDNMHQLNTQYGYETVNEKIRTALQVRSEDLLLTGLWFSGDEIVFIIRSDPQGFCNRIQSSFKEHAMGITLAFEQIANGDVDRAIDIAATSVQLQKANRK